MKIDTTRYFLNSLAFRDMLASVHNFHDSDVSGANRANEDCLVITIGRVYFVEDDKYNPNGLKGGRLALKLKRGYPLNIADLISQFRYIMELKVSGETVVINFGYEVFQINISSSESFFEFLT